MVTRDFRHHLETNFPGPILLTGDTVLVGLGGLPEALSIAARLNLVIDGLEGFRTDGTSVTPLTDYIADLTEIDGTWTERVRRSLESALAIAEAWSCGPEFVELIVASQNE